MFNILSVLGRLRLRSLSDELMIERLTAERDAWEARFKRVVTDLAAQSVKAADLAVEVEKLRAELIARKRLAELQGAVMEKLRPDAEAFRKKRANDAALKREKRAAAKQADAS